MELDDIRVRGRPLILASDADIDAAETVLGVPFPPGYREYLTRLGEGDLGDFVTVYPPWWISRRAADRERLRAEVAGYYNWEDPSPPITREQGSDGYFLGHTGAADYLLVSRTCPDRVFILPRHPDVVVDAGRGLFAALERLRFLNTRRPSFPLRFSPRGWPGA